MILLPAVLAGIVIALARGGSFRRLADLPFRLGWVAILALVAQLFVIYSSGERLEPQRSLHAALLVGSSALLLLVVWVNRRLPAMPIIGLGLLLNIAVMSANGGFMPVSREAALAAGTRSSQDALAEGARLSRSKDVLLAPGNTRLWLLSDVIVAPPPLSRVYSPGDLVVAVGVFVMLQAAMLPRANRGTMKEGSAAQRA